MSHCLPIFENREYRKLSLFSKNSADKNTNLKVSPTTVHSKIAPGVTISVRNMRNTGLFVLSNVFFIISLCLSVSFAILVTFLVPPFLSILGLTQSL
jgi:hypothetical protein